MKVIHRFSNREDVVSHLVGQHNWPDPAWEHGWGPDVTMSQVKAGDARPFIPTSEYLAIHRELEALS